MYSRLKFLLVLIGVLLLSGCGVFRSTERFSFVNLKPDTPEYYEFVALNYYQRGEYKESILYYEALIKSFSGRREVYDTELAWAEYEIGFCHYKLKQFETAYLQFKKVVSDYGDLGAVTLAGQRVRDLEDRFPALALLE